MKRITKEEKAKIKKWQDVPLSKGQLKRIKVRDETKYYKITDEDYKLNEETLAWINAAVERGDVVRIGVEQEGYEGSIEEMYLHTTEYPYDTMRLETDEEYEKRMVSLKKMEWEQLSLQRKLDKRYQDSEYKMYVRLRKKYEV